MNKFGILILLFGTLLSCNDDDSTSVQEQNRIEIENYLSANNLVASHTSSGLYYNISNEGNGVKPTLSSQVSVIYKGRKMSNEEVFDETNSPITFPLNRLIEGWQEGLQLISSGGSMTLYVPAHLAYGAGEPSNNGVIIFDIALVSVF